MTRDEFLDIMGGIDEKLIGSTLEVTRAEVIKPQRVRPSVWRYVMGAAACVAILVTVFAVGFLKGIPTQPDDSSGSAANSASDIIRGWDPEKLTYSDTPVLGGNMRVSVAELDGITAELILHNIKKGAGMALFAKRAYINQYEDTQAQTGQINEEFSEQYNYADYVGAEDIVLYVHDDKGRRFIETSVTPHSYNGMELISAKCLFGDSTRLYNVNGDYFLIQYAAHICNYFSVDDTKLDPIYLARFYKLDLNQQKMRDENGIYTGGLTSVKFDNGLYSCNWEYGYPVTREFEYVTSGYFYDSGYKNQTTYGYTFEGIKFYTTIPEDIMFKLLP